MKINWTQEKKDAVCKEIENWIIEYDASSGEHIMQCDDCLIDAPNFLSIIIDDIIKPEWEEM